MTVNHLVAGSSPAQRANFILEPPKILRYSNSITPLNSDAIQEAEEAGFDLNLIELNLSLSPSERIEQHQSALDLVLELESIRTNRNEDAK